MALNTPKANFVFLSVLLAALVGAIFWLITKNFFGTKTPLNVESAVFQNRAPSPENPGLEEKYRSEIRAILQDFTGSGEAKKTYEKLLQVIVPSQNFQDFHLDLVILFDSLSRAEDEKKMEERSRLMQKYEELLKKNEWLKAL